MSSLDIEEQHAYFTHCLSKKLHARVAPKIRGATPVLALKTGQDGTEPESCFKILDDPHLARGHHLVAIAGDGHEIDLDWQIEAAHQIGDEDKGAAQKADNDKLFGVLILLRDHPCQLRCPRRDLGFGNQDFDIMFGGQDCHALAPMGPGGNAGG